MKGGEAMKRNLILLVMAVMIVVGIGATSVKAFVTRSEVQAERLSQLVKDGKITESQKQAIISKRAELDTWSTQNKIDLRYLFGFGGGRGMGHMFRD